MLGGYVMKCTEEQKKTNKKELIWRIISTGGGVLLTDYIIDCFFYNNFLIGLVLVCIICGFFEIVKFFVLSVIDNRKKKGKRT